MADRGGIYKKIFGLLWYNPYFAGVAGIVLFSILQYMLVSCWRRVNEQPNRLVRMMKEHLGVEYVRADWDRIEYARTIAGDMPCYPDEGYVQLRDDLIIVKMGE